MASVQSSLWDEVTEQTKSAQSRGTEPLMWAIQLSSTLNSAGVSLPSIDVANLLVSHICWSNNVPIAWKFLEQALTLRIVPPLFVLALLSIRVIPARRSYPAAYRIYMELVKRYAFSLPSLINGPNYQKIMESINDALHLSEIYGIQGSESGLVLVEFVFTVVCQLLDASLDDEGLLELSAEKKSRWPIAIQEVGISNHNGFDGKRLEHHEGFCKMNTVLAIEIIAEFFRDKLTSTVLYLARRNIPTHWESFIQHLQLLVSNSSALRNSKNISPEALVQLTSNNRRVLTRECKTSSQQLFHAVVASGSFASSAGQCHGASPSVLWLPIDLFLEDTMDESQVAATSAADTLTGLVKALQAVNRTTWHDTFLGLWIAGLRLVIRETYSSEGPVPRLDTCLCLLLSITPLAICNIIEEEESDSSSIELRKQSTKRRQALVSSLQQLHDYEGLLTPPQPVIPLANQAAAKAMMFLSGLSVGSGYFDGMSLNDMPVNCAGNLRHLIVEACIARNILDTSAYLWPGYVKGQSNQVPHSMSGPIPGWSSLMKGSLLTPAMVNVLVSTPASSLAEVEKIYEIAVNGPDEEKIIAATIICGASLARGWNIQEHTVLFITRLLSPPVPADYSGTESHLINYAPFLNVLLVGISSVDCVQIFCLQGLVPQLAGVLMPICEVFGSCAPNVSWTIMSEEISSHAVFSNAFTLLLKLWRFDQPPIEHFMGGVIPVGAYPSPEYLLLVRNSQLACSEDLLKDQSKTKQLSRSSPLAGKPIFIDSFPKLKLWYQQNQACIASPLSVLVPGTPVHQIVEALLNFMFRKINRAGKSLISTTYGSSSSSGSGNEDVSLHLKLPAWDILEAVPFVLDAALTACAHGTLSPRELATGLKDLADFLPASLATIVSYFSAEVTRGIWKVASMNGTDWPSPAANLATVEQQIKKILAATGVDVPSLTVGGTSPSILPLPLAALVSLTITYKLDRATGRFLDLMGPALSKLGARCPWPCMPVISALWVQKVRRWNDFLVFYASQTVFYHNNDAVVQLLRACFTATLGLSTSSLASNGGVGALLGHGFGSHFSGGLSPVAPGILYLRVHRAVRNVTFLTEEVVSLLMHLVREIANSGLPTEKMEKLKKTKYWMRYGQVSLAAAMTRVKIAASLGASLVWITGGLNLVQSLIKETLPSWFISAQGSEINGGVSGGMIAMLGGYALAYFAVLSGTFAWGVDSLSPASKRRPSILEAHLKFLASAVDGKISLGCNKATWRAYVSAFVSLMVGCTPCWILEVDVEVLKRLSKGLKQWDEEELAFALLEASGVGAMGTAAEMIIEGGFKHC